MSLSAAVVSILTSAVITLGLRAFPFLVFGKQRRMPDKLVRLGDMLPSAIMAVLVIYCLKDVGLMRMSRLKILRTVFNVYVEILRGTPILLQLYFFWIGLPKLAAVVMVMLSYHLSRNTLVSIFVGTAGYMLLIRLL